MSLGKKCNRERERMNDQKCPCCMFLLITCGLFLLLGIHWALFTVEEWKFFYHDAWGNFIWESAGW